LELATETGGAELGSSILFSVLARLTLGNIPEGYDILIHPVAFAGWIGLLVTSFNLMPVGQLDGGHVAYAILGEKHRRVSLIVILFLFFLGSFGWKGWLFWGFLLTIMGLSHPRPLDQWTPLDRKRKVVAFITLIVFVLTFTPVPFRFV
jgi:membrane-associated protease RseP (regulator of RpoE activity)